MYLPAKVASRRTRHQACVITRPGDERRDTHDGETVFRKKKISSSLTTFAFPLHSVLSSHRHSEEVLQMDVCVCVCEGGRGGVQEPPAGRCLSQDGCHGTSPQQHMEQDRGVDPPSGGFDGFLFFSLLRLFASRSVPTLFFSPPCFVAPAKEHFNVTFSLHTFFLIPPSPRNTKMFFSHLKRSTIYILEVWIRHQSGSQLYFPQSKKYQ